MAASLARAWSIGLVGLAGHLVEVEADLAQGLPGLTVIGLPDTSVGEARDRVRAAVVNSGQRWPSRRITLALSPASVPKRGSGFDLALAAAVLAADGVVPAESLVGRVLLGELGLDGRVRPVAGVLPSLLTALRAGVDRAVVPGANLAEAQLLPGIEAAGVATLTDLVRLLTGQDYESGQPPSAVSPTVGPPAPDMADVVGQVAGRSAMEVAAAGGHHVLLLGPPGAGKTMLAERLPGLLPDLDLDAALDVTAIHSVAGLLTQGCPLVTRPPFQDPHHTATVASVVGGGSGLARPGAATLAHRGVLFLDEAPEFKRGVLDALRQPLESGRLSLTRVGGTAIYPARFTLVLAANPCPCALATCTCPPDSRRRYLARLSGPLLDRIDLHVSLGPVSTADLAGEPGEATAAIAARVAEARARAAARLRGTPWATNADVPAVEVRRRWPLSAQAQPPLDAAVTKGLLTARGHARVVRVAWTLADLAGRDRPGPGEVYQALGFRLGHASVAA